MIAGDYMSGFDQALLLTLSYFDTATF